MTDAPRMTDLLTAVRACRICEGLPLGPRPILQVSASARVLIAGQAPGRKTHEKGVPFDDPSGDRLRDWLGVDRHTFYNDPALAVLPMGFCYPGTGKSGDLPPRTECAVAWRQSLLDQMKDIDLVLIIGRYAIDWHLPDAQGKKVTELARNWQSDWPRSLILPHPSPRNNRWLKQNPWFAAEVIPMLRARVHALLKTRPREK